MTTTSQGPGEPTTTQVRVGPYRLLARIGEGGMGVVHLAQAPDGARVALKVLRPHVIGDDEARERLSREVASLRRVVSPRVAEVIDADPWGVTPFVATRYVPGLSLHQHVREHGALDGADLRWFARCLAEAMAAVHAVGVLHRDIKPSNVLLEGRSPVLIDFGLARLAEDPRLTHTGWLLGTPGYLAPEILYGEDATTASDVHAWAATVVFAATGRPPYGTGPTMAVMDRVRRGEHDLAGTPAELVPLLRRGLAPDPAVRPTTDQLLGLLARLEGPPPAPAVAEPAATVPWVLASRDTAPTGPTSVTAPGLGAARAPGPVAAPTRAYTAVAPLPPAGPMPAPPAREPYVQPPTPSRNADRPRLVPPLVVRTATSARVQRAILLGGTSGLVVAGVAVAPYLAFLALAVAVLLVRTWSWTAQAARERQHLRGRRRWYDAPLTALSSPWYLVVAAGGTALLLGWAAMIASVVGLALALLTRDVTLVLLGAGVVLALGSWWGPGSKRLRLPLRHAVGALTRDPWIGWTAVAAVLVVLGPLLLAVLEGQLTWDPAAGAPWRDGTTLGRLRAWL